MLISLEGIDGAGKNTLMLQLSELLPHCTSLSFPRYEDSLHAHLAQRALRGEMGDLVDSRHGMATLFALDRAAVIGELMAAAEDPDSVLLLDRYVASNAAYTQARAGGDVQAAEWVAQLEFGLLGLPRCDLTVLVDTPVEVARERAERREAQDSRRTRDAYERDAALQHATATAYRELAEAQWEGPWLVVSPEESAEAAAQRIVVALNVAQS